MLGYSIERGEICGHSLLPLRGENPLKLEKLRAVHGEKKSKEIGREFRRSGVKPPSLSLSQFEIAYCDFQPKESWQIHSQFFKYNSHSVWDVSKALGPDHLLTSDFQASSFILCVSSNFVWWKFPNTQYTWKMKKASTCISTLHKTCFITYLAISLSGHKPVYFFKIKYISGTCPVLQWFRLHAPKN